MLKKLVAWLLDMIAAWAGFERTAKRDEQEKKAADESIADANAAADATGGVPKPGDPYARD